MAEICGGLEDLDEAEKFYEEAWEIEKSLGQGNHSEVMVRIVENYEAMLPKGARKEKFQKEAFEFYSRYWDEERAFEGFEFSLANKKVIKFINERLSKFDDKQTQKKYQREALWFYEGAWNSPDTKKLPDNEREDILQNLLRLCKMLGEEDLAKKYKSELFRFYEKKWKREKEKIERQDKVDILIRLKELASSLMNEKKVKKYESLLKEAKQRETWMGTLRSYFLSGSAAEQLSSDEEDDDDDFARGNDDENSDQSSAESEEVEDPDRIKIQGGEITDKGDTWNLEKAGAVVTFSPGFVKEPLLITCSLWSPGALSPVIASNEVLVSNVIKLSHDCPPDLEFMEDATGSITVALLHSASNFKGYEVVIKQLVDSENNEWEDLETKNVWLTSVHARPAIPNWMFPFAEATCARACFSSFAAIWRLKSFVFPRPKSVTPPEFICTVPDYPNVSVAIPWNSVPANEDFCSTLKVQEPPSIDCNGEGMLVGPILHVSCSQNVELLEPAKINFPLALFKGDKELADLQSGQWRILHFQSSKNSHEWTDITGQLQTPVILKDGIVTFQVKTFCRFWPWWLKKPTGDLWRYASGLYDRIMKQRAGFLACLCDDAVPARYLLKLFCFPLNLKSQVNSDVSVKYLVNMQGEGTSLRPLFNEDETFVSLSKGFMVHGAENIEDVFLTFLGKESFERSLRVTIEDFSNLQVDFFKWADGTKRKNSVLICPVPIIPTSPLQREKPTLYSQECHTDTDHGASAKRLHHSTLKHGNVDSPPSCTIAPKRMKLMAEVRETVLSDEDLEWLSQEIAEGWKPLGRRLQIEEPRITAFDRENEEYSEKAYKMLLHWKQREGSGASLEVMFDSLCHSFVTRKDLAEELCSRRYR